MYFYVLYCQHINIPIINHFHILAKSTKLHCAFHLRRGGVLWPHSLIVVVGTEWK